MRKSSLLIVIIKTFRHRKCKKHRACWGVAEKSRIYLLMPLWFRVAIRYGGRAALCSSSRLQLLGEMETRTTFPFPPRTSPLPLAQRLRLRVPSGCPLLNYCETIVFSYDQPTRSSRRRFGAFVRLTSVSGISSICTRTSSVGKKRRRKRDRDCVCRLYSPKMQGKSRNLFRYKAGSLANARLPERAFFTVLLTSGLRRLSS